MVPLTSIIDLMINGSFTSNRAARSNLWLGERIEEAQDTVNNNYSMGMGGRIVELFDFPFHFKIMDTSTLNFEWSLEVLAE